MKNFLRTTRGRIALAAIATLLLVGGVVGGASAHQANVARATAAQVTEDRRVERTRATHAAAVVRGRDVETTGNASLDASKGKASAAARTRLSGALDRLHEALSSGTNREISVSSTEVTENKKVIEGEIAKYEAEQARIAAKKVEDQRLAAAKAEADRVAAAKAEATRVAAAKAESARVAAAKAEAARVAAAAAKAAQEAVLSFGGHITSSWVLSDELGALPTDCSGSASSYQVALLDGSNSTLALAKLEHGRVTERSVDEYGIGSLVCDFGYSLRTSSPSPVFTVQLISGDKELPVKDEKVLGRAELKSGRGPNLEVTFCPECSDSQ